MTKKHQRPQQLLFTVPEVAKILGLGQTKTWTLVAMHEIRSVTIGRARRVPYEALIEFIEELEAEAKEDISR